MGRERNRNRKGGGGRTRGARAKREERVEKKKKRKATAKRKGEAKPLLFRFLFLRHTHTHTHTHIHMHTHTLTALSHSGRCFITAAVGSSLLQTRQTRHLSTPPRLFRNLYVVTACSPPSLLPRCNSVALSLLSLSLATIPPALLPSVASTSDFLVPRVSQVCLLPSCSPSATPFIVSSAPTIVKRCLCSRRPLPADGIAERKKGSHRNNGESGKCVTVPQRQPRCRRLRGSAVERVSLPTLAVPQRALRRWQRRADTRRPRQRDEGVSPWR